MTALYLRLALFILIALTYGTCTRQTENQSIVMRIGHPMAPGNNVTLGYEKFKELVERKSRGRIIIKLYPDTFLGSDLITMKAVQKGELEMASSSTPNMEGISKKFIAFDLPYITRPENQVRLYKALDEGELGRYLDRISAEVGLKPIMWSEYGYRNFATVTKKLRLPGDLKGLRMRTTQSPVEIELAKGLGAKPISLVWSDTYPELLRGNLDGEGNTCSLLYSAKHHEVLRFITMTQHNYSMHVLMMNRSCWDRLPPDSQKIITEAAREALDYERAISRDMERDAMQQMQARGIKVIELTSQEQAEWIQAAKPMWSLFQNELPAELLQLIMETQRQ